MKNVKAVVCILNMERRLTMRPARERVPLEEIAKQGVQCKTCVKLLVDKKALDCECIAFDNLYYDWPNSPKTCFGYEGNEQAWSDSLDEMHRYSKERLTSANIPSNGPLSIPNMRKNLISRAELIKMDRKLTREETTGIASAYHESIHPQLLKAPSNDSCGTRCKIIKKTPMLDCDGGGESWKGIGAMASCMGEYDAINARKRKRAADAKKAGKSNPAGELKGVRKPNTGRAKESKNSDDSVMVMNQASGKVVKSTVKFNL